MFIIGFTTSANAVTVEIPQVEETKVFKLDNVYGSVYTKDQIAELVNANAIKYGVSASKMMNTIECESSYKNVQSSHILGVGHKAADKNGREDSWGISQINMYWHPEVSKKQALDPYFAVQFMARQFSLGKASEWSCYRLKYQ